MVEGGPIDVLTGDYLAELTMLILWKARQKDPAPATPGRSSPSWSRCSAPAWTAASRSSTTRAGSTRPAWPAARGAGRPARPASQDRLRRRATTCSARLKDLLAAGTRWPTSTPASRWPTPAGSRSRPTPTSAAGGSPRRWTPGRTSSICPRVTDASLVTGPAAWWHGWRRDDFDQLAGAVAAGHVIECGPQATGGNYSYLHEITDRRYPGFPDRRGRRRRQQRDHQARRAPAALVSVGTVTAQLLYEIAEPAYLNPDVVAHFDTITLEQLAGPTGCGYRGIGGSPPPRHAQGGDQLPRAATATR